MMMMNPLDGKDSDSSKSGGDLNVRAKRACLWCRKGHRSCDNERPCSRCKRLGRECIDVEPASWRRKRTRRKKDLNNPMNEMAIAPPTMEFPLKPKLQMKKRRQRIDLSEKTELQKHSLPSCVNTGKCSFPNCFEGKPTGDVLPCMDRDLVADIEDLIPYETRMNFPPRSGCMDCEGGSSRSNSAMSVEDTVLIPTYQDNSYGSSDLSYVDNFLQFPDADYPNFVVPEGKSSPVPTSYFPASSPTRSEENIFSPNLDLNQISTSSPQYSDLLYQSLLYNQPEQANTQTPLNTVPVQNIPYDENGSGQYYPDMLATEIPIEKLRDFGANEAPSQYSSSSFSFEARSDEGSEKRRVAPGGGQQRDGSFEYPRMVPSKR